MSFRGIKVFVLQYMRLKFFLEVWFCEITACVWCLLKRGNKIISTCGKSCYAGNAMAITEV